jgi:hypothetical protein
LAIGANVGATTDDESVAHSPELAALNDRLRAAGITDVAIDRAELLVAGAASGDQATTLIANDRTHLLTLQFVENDSRRPSPANTITYLVDQSDGSALGFNAAGAVITLPNSVTEPELDASMEAWGAMGCNGPIIMKVADTGADPDLVDAIVFNNPALLGTPYSADIVHAGWLPRAFFDTLLPPNGSARIIGVTFSFIFVDEDDEPTDVDRDGRADVAWREIYYNRRFPWGTGGNENNVDIQSVAIHEAGHGLGLAHFGKLFLKASGDIQFAPKAIMNAAYVSEDRTIRGTDNGSFCHIWANSH